MLNNSGNLILLTYLLTYLHQLHQLLTSVICELFIPLDILVHQVLRMLMDWSFNHKVVMIILSHGKLTVELLPQKLFIISQFPTYLHIYINDHISTCQWWNRFKGKLSAKIQNLIFGKISTTLYEIEVRFSKFGLSHE